MSKLGVLGFKALQGGVSRSLLSYHTSIANRRQFALRRKVISGTPAHPLLANTRRTKPPSAWLNLSAGRSDCLRIYFISPVCDLGDREIGACRKIFGTGNLKVMEEQQKSDVLREIKSLHEKKEFESAKPLVLGLVKVFPDCKDCITASIDNCRGRKALRGAVKFSRRLLNNYPDWFDSYARLSEDLLALRLYDDAVDVIEEGLKKFPDNKWILHTALRAYKRAIRLEDAIAQGDRLAKHHPKFKAFYKEYIDVLISNGDLTKAQEIISSLEDPQVTLNAKLDLFLALGRYSDYQRVLLSALAINPSIVIDRRRKIGNSIILGAKRNSSLEICRHTADVICIASDEAPYIHEFIHHYLYLGFKRIFIGLNNCSDNTEKIAELISRRYSEVHLIDVDNLIGAFRQRGCYAFLFEYAKGLSDSEYAFFVDIDEFWVAEPFPRTVSEFLSDNCPDIDCYSFQWINVAHESAFSAPLRDLGAVKLNRHVKSMLRYDSDVISIGAHAPTFGNISPARTMVGHVRDRNISRSRGLSDVHQLSTETDMPDLHQKGLAWVFHRRTRSEIEFCHHLFKTHANDDKSVVKFKRNRKRGFEKFDNTLHENDFLRRLFPSDVLESYHRSLSSFVIECEIEEELAEARAIISESKILEMLDKIPDNIFEMNVELLLSSFSGTRFVEKIIERKHAIFTPSQGHS